MKVISWNILSNVWLNPKDKEYKKIPKSKLNLSYRIKKIVERLKRFNADVILLQEVSTAEYKYIETEHKKSKLIKHYKRHWQNEAVKYLPNGNIILWNKKLNAKINEILLSPDGNKAAIAIIPEQDLTIVSVHLDDASKGLRNQQMRTLLKSITTSKAIIGGDFNATPDEYIHTIMKKNGYSTNINNATYPLSPSGIFDYIYVKGMKISEFDVCNTLINKNNDVNNNKEIILKYGSDHYPIFAHLQ